MIPHSQSMKRRSWVLALATALRAYQGGLTSQATFVNVNAHTPPPRSREFTQIWRRPAPDAGVPVDVVGPARSGPFWFLAALLVLLLCAVSFVLERGRPRREPRRAPPPPPAARPSVSGARLRPGPAAQSQ